MANSLQKEVHLKDSTKISKNMLEMPRVGLTSEQNPRCELTARAEGERVHVFTLRASHTPRFQSIVQEVADRIKSGGMSKFSAIELRDKLLAAKA